MVKNNVMVSLALYVILTLTGCASGSDVTIAVASTGQMQSAAVSVEETIPAEVTTPVEKTTVFTNRDLDASYSEADCIAIELKGSQILCNSDAVEISDAMATIQKEGTYLISGTLEDGSIVVDAEKTEKIQLVLNGVTIHSEASAPIYIRQADKVFLTLAPGTRNTLSNGGSFTPDGETNIDSVIFSRDDLTLNGSGALAVTSPAGHGIVSKDSLRITGGTYAMDVSGHGLCGKDEVSIADGSFDIIAGKDGIHGENSEDADAGTVYLENGTYRITASGDGISASGNCTVVDGDYTITTGGGSETVQRATSSQGFGRGQFGGSVPTNRAQFDAQSMPERDAEGKGGMGGMSGKGMDRINQMPANGQNSVAPAEETGTESTKGIKAASLTMDGGSFHIDSEDDGLHSNSSLTLRGSTLEIASGDDGIHADETVTIVSGSINIPRSYEGIEGQHVEILGGDITLAATDDGLNAAGGMDGSGFGRRGETFTPSGDTSSIVISGGNIRITASADGIDANGTLEITGGTVTVSGPTYGDTAVLDFDRSGTISGGTFIGTGAATMAQTFTGSTQGVISVNAGSQSAGTQITLTDSSGSTILSHTPELDFEIVILSCPAIASGESYTLRVGNTTQDFTAK